MAKRLDEIPAAHLLVGQGAGDHPVVLQEQELPAADSPTNVERKGISCGWLSESEGGRVLM
jgi:hypothetical protein